jgi:hypothetical protein
MSRFCSEICQEPQPPPVSVEAPVSMYSRSVVSLILTFASHEVCYDWIEFRTILRPVYVDAECCRTERNARGYDLATNTQQK